MFGISSVGRRTGEAIVVLETPEMAELAVKRHKFFMDSRYIEVSYAVSWHQELQFVHLNYC